MIINKLKVYGQFLAEQAQKSLFS